MLERINFGKNVPMVTLTNVLKPDIIGNYIISGEDELLEKLSIQLNEQNCKAYEMNWIGCSCMGKWKCDLNYNKNKIERTNKDENHWLIFINGYGVKSQGVRMITMLKRSQMWINLITEEGAVTDQMIIQFRLFDLLEDIAIKK